jgi:hypothetical protein
MTANSRLFSVNQNMLSWKLWRALHFPPTVHPVFQRANAAQQITFGWPVDHRFFAGRTFRVTLLILLGLISLSWPELLVLLLVSPVVVVFLAVISPIWLPLLIFSYGVYLTVSISDAIFKENARATHDLLYLAPAGPIGIDWTISSGVLHRGETFELLHLAVRFVLLLLGIMLLVMLLVLPIIIFGAGYRISATDLALGLSTVTEAASLVGLFYTGYSQSIVLSVIVGMLAPHYVKSGGMVGVGAAGAFTALQIGSYTVGILLTFAALPQLLAALSFQGWPAEVIVALLRFVIIYGIREWMIYGLWRRLMYCLNVDTVEI